ncbi:hypothetical protein PBI_MIMI_46 [Arthrobacter phage Mimi]|nr:hypothetical protein PBI_MIMI_126 [Arthrobacter phage Mimi]
MTKINLAPTTKEELTEKLQRYYLTLGNLNGLHIKDPDHDRFCEEITSAFIDTLTTTDTEPAAKGKPIGYVVAYTHKDQPLIPSESLDRFYPTLTAAEKAVETALLSSTSYRILPVHAS